MKPRPTKTKAEFGAVLRKHRTSAGRSIADLARAVRIDETSLSRIETGAKQPPDVSTLMQMASALKIPQGSQEFEELWRLAEQERHPDTDATKYIASMKDLAATVLRELVEDLQIDTAPSSADVPVLPVLVADTAALIAQSSEEIARRGATSITVRFADGTTKRWKVASQEQRRV